MMRSGDRLDRDDRGIEAERNAEPLRFANERVANVACTVAGGKELPRFFLELERNAELVFEEAALLVERP